MADRFWNQTDGFFGLSYDPKKSINPLSYGAVVGVTGNAAKEKA